jgi:hypothetical protein
VAIHDKVFDGTCDMCLNGFDKICGNGEMMVVWSSNTAEMLHVVANLLLMSIVFDSVIRFLSDFCQQEKSFNKSYKTEGKRSVRPLY